MEGYMSENENNANAGGNKNAASEGVTGAGEETKGGVVDTPLAAAGAPKTAAVPLKRVFVYDSREYADPDPTLPIETIKEALAMSLPELANSTFKKKKRSDGVEEIAFEKVSGGKG
jgi:PRTRC genetic system protein C